jgi:hypothetical protein
LQATEGEAAEADHSLGGESRPRRTNDRPNRIGLVGRLPLLLRTSLLLLVAVVLAAGCGFGGGGDLTLGYENVELELADEVGLVYRDLIEGNTDAFLDA